MNKTQRIITILSGIAFLASTIFMAAGVFSVGDKSKAPPKETNPEAAAKEQLLSQEKGYAKVLEREPNNLIALQGVIQSRLTMGKYKEAVQPLEKLGELEPTNQEVWKALAAIHIQLQNYQEAIAPMEKLVALNPEPELKKQLEELKKAAKGGVQPENNSPAP